MSFLLVDDKFHAHKKARRAGAEALGLWVVCGSHAAGMDAGGFLEADEVATIALTLRLKEWKRAAAKLVEVGLWDAVGSDFQIHDWDHYRKGADREAIRKEKDAKRKRERRGNVEVEGEMSADIPRTRPRTEIDASADTDNDRPRTPETASEDAPSRARAPVHSVPSSPILVHAAAIPDADKSASGGEVLDMGELRRLWNGCRERATASAMPAIHDPDDLAVLGSLPKAHRLSGSALPFADWIADQFTTWHRETTQSHGSGATRLTSCWAPKSFSGWFERKGSHGTPKARHEAPGPYVHRSDLPLVAPIRKPPAVMS